MVASLFFSLFFQVFLRLCRLEKMRVRRHCFCFLRFFGRTDENMSVIVRPKNLEMYCGLETMEGTYLLVINSSALGEWTAPVDYCVVAVCALTMTSSQGV